MNPWDATRESGLEDLLGAANAALEQARLPAADPRTGESLDVRTFRYYRTLGLVDAPLRYDGVRGVFGQKHLLQAIAIKALQRHGLSLAEAGRRLARLATPALRDLVASLLQAPDKRKAALLADTPVPPPPKAAPASAAAVPPPAGETLTLDLAPGLTLHADLARATELVPAFPRIRRRFEELLALLTRLSGPDQNPPPATPTR